MSKSAANTMICEQLRDVYKRQDKYILLSAHREENIDSEKNFLSLFTAINALAEKYDMPILYSCHPRSLSLIHISEKGLRFQDEHHRKWRDGNTAPQHDSGEEA